LSLAGISQSAIRLINFRGQQDYKIGWYSRDKNTYRDVIDAIISPLGISLRRNRLGEHELIAIRKSTPVLTLDVDDIFTISASGIEPTKVTVELAYNRNFSVQSNGSLALIDDLGLKPEDHAHYQQEYAVLSAKTGKSALSNDATFRVDTVLTDQQQAEAELKHLESDYGHIRRNWKIEAYALAITVQLGDTITIDDPMLSADVIVLGFEKVWTDQIVIIEVTE